MTLNDHEPYAVKDFGDFWAIFGFGEHFASELRRNWLEIN